jgi:hypothetical protein
MSLIPTKTLGDYKHLESGNVKFRLNNVWTINYGSRNNDEGIVLFR